MNSKFALCNRLHIYGNRLPVVSERFNSNFKACNRLHTYCNRLPEEFFRKHSQQSHLFMWLLNDYHRPIYMWLKHKIAQRFSEQQVFILSKSKIIFILLRIPWPIQLQFIKELFECSTCKIYLFLERFILLLLLIL